MNNVDKEAVENTKTAVEEDPKKGEKTKSVEGGWNVDGPQFSAEIEFEDGTETLQADMPSPMGGEGRAPGPMKYCLFGAAACFATTLATVATDRNVEISSLEVEAETAADMAKPLGAGDDPIVEQVTFRIDLDADATDEEVQEMVAEAEDRCPGSYCLSNPIPLDVELES